MLDLHLLDGAGGLFPNPSSVSNPNSPLHRAGTQCAWDSESTFSDSISSVASNLTSPLTFATGICFGKRGSGTTSSSSRLRGRSLSTSFSAQSLDGPDTGISENDDRFSTLFGGRGPEFKSRSLRRSRTQPPNNSMFSFRNHTGASPKLTATSFLSKSSPTGSLDLVNDPARAQVRSSTSPSPPMTTTKTMSNISSPLSTVAPVSNVPKTSFQEDDEEGGGGMGAMVSALTGGMSEDQLNGWAQQHTHHMEGLGKPEHMMGGNEEMQEHLHGFASIAHAMKGDIKNPASQMISASLGSFMPGFLHDKDRAKHDRIIENL